MTAPFAARLAAPASMATLLLPLLLLAAPASATNFSCLTVGKTCQSAIGYKVPNATTYGEVVARFDPTTTLAKLLDANNLTASTPASTSLAAKTTVRVPFRCRCGSNGVGQSDGGPIYVVYPEDGLDHIAREVFDAFVTYQEIATANDIADVDLILTGQKLRIPLPCTCDQVDDADVMHFAYSVAKGDDLTGIAAKFGVNEDTLMSVNKITDPKQSLQQGQILDVPLSVSVPTTVTAVPPTGTDPPQPETGKGGLAQRLEAIVIPVFFFIIIVLVVSIVVKHYQKKRKMENFQIVTGLKDFSYDNIKSATMNFDKDKLLGEGGFGKVYKGTFNIDRKPKVLAVKCVTNPSAAKYLKDELKILAELKHKNMVQLVGFCNNDGWFRRGRGLYVCSEFISNGPLDKKIFGSLGQPVIEWPIRCEIIRGICAGLQYLHQDHNSKILHMDLKPSNILLDEEMKPKIADFGLSRAFLNAKTHTYTDIVKGSLGYMAPEFVDHGRASHQCDIYSLGMLILGIVMRVGPPSTSHDPSGVSYINKVREKFILVEATTTVKRCSAKDHEQLKKDASLQDDDSIEEVEKCVGLAFECVNEDPKKRPEAADICTRLNLQDNRSHISLQVNEVQK